MKTLITYATRTGSTVGVAEAIAKTLRENGIEVNVFPMQEDTDLSPYQAVVAGSAIQNWGWLPEAFQFCKHINLS
jgi:menaquinone-dependent protoporphyrinogen oxidase